MQPKRALKQLTFFGKKSVPGEIRPDLWRPLATVFFPSQHQGLNAYRRLREFRKKHELSWPEASDGKTSRPPKRDRIRQLMDQKANAVADLAAVLHIQKDIGTLQAASDAARLAQKNDMLTREQAEKERLAGIAHAGGLERLGEIARKLETRYESAVNPERKKALSGQLRACRRKIHEMAVARKEIATQNSASSLMQEPAETRVDQKNEACIVPTVDIPEVESIVEAETVEKKYPRQLISRQFLDPKQSRPNMTLNGVAIEWADMTDASYAPRWPRPVLHFKMLDVRSGLVAPTFQRRKQDVLDSLTEYREQEEQMDQERFHGTQSVSEGFAAEQSNAGVIGKLRSLFGRNVQHSEHPSV